MLVQDMDTVLRHKNQEQTTRRPSVWIVCIFPEHLITSTHWTNSCENNMTPLHVPRIFIGVKFTERFEILRMIREEVAAVRF